MTLHARVLGKGKPLVMIHGWGLNSGVFEPVMEALAESYQVMAVDLPGHGGSTLDREFTLEQVTSALAKTAPDNAHWLGWSLGGSFAMTYAAKFPTRVTSLTLVTATPRFVKADDWPCGMDASVLDQFAASLGTDYAGTVNRFLSLVARGAPESGALLRRLRAAMKLSDVPDAAALTGGLDILRNADLRKLLPDIFCPTLMLHGGRDTLVSAKCAEPACAMISDCRSQIIADAGHAPFLSHPDKFIEVVTGFAA